MLSALPVYYLSLFRMPEEVAKEIERLQDTFLWGGSKLRRKIQMVRWVDVCKSTDQGGLGIRRVRVVTICLLVKWWWKFCVENEAPWKKIICSRYKLKVDSWLPYAISSSNSSVLWKGITAIADQSNNLLEVFLNNFQLKIGDGRRISF